uniref:Uncharacterized protein n=1 Tax=Arundo donax TaxID=35708 RepID=A0A0A9EH10_ARUDO
MTRTACSFQIGNNASNSKNKGCRPTIIFNKIFSNLRY